MKKAKFITGWTDYPFLELGDEEHKAAPIRRVIVVDYDGNKYATIRFLDNGFELQLKAGYLYRHRGRLGQVRQINRRKLERSFGWCTKSGVGTPGYFYHRRKV